MTKHLLKPITLLIALFVSGYSILAQPANPPAPGSWDVVDALTDNFNSFNGNKWVKRNHDTGPEGHRWVGRAPGKFFTSQSTVQNGKLRITATAAYNPGNAQTNCSYWLKTGFVYSKTKAQVGWYTECSMKASDLSMASSFWMKLGTQNNQEIDITETYGNGRNTRWWDDKIRPNSHVFQGGNDFASGTPAIDVTNNAANFPRNRFYRVGMHWKSTTRMDIYVDGDYKLTIATNGNRSISEPLRLIWDMEPFIPACSNGPGGPDYAHVRPNNPTRRNYMEVDWVKTWKPASGGGGGGGSSAPIGKVISLRKTGGDRKYVRALQSGTNNLAADASSVQGWERYNVENHPQGGIALKAQSNNKYVQVQGNNQNLPVRARGASKQGWERLEWKSKGAGKVAIKSLWTNKWLQCAWNQNNAIMYPKGASDQGWETFDFAILGNARVGEDQGYDPVTEDLILKAYPNPVDGANLNLDVIMPAAGDLEANIYDSYGKLVYSNSFGNLSIGGHTITIDFDKLNVSDQGIYILNVRSGGITKNLKLAF